MKLTVVFVALCCSLIFFSGCNKDKNDSPVKKKLMAGMWQISGETVTFKYNGKDTTIDEYSQWRTCEQDDLVMFDAEGKGVKNENTEKCSEDDQMDSFKWELLDNDTKLRLSLEGTDAVFQFNGAQVYICDVLEVTDTYVKLNITDSTRSVPRVVTETYRNIK